MSIDFEGGWLQHTVDHLTTESLARRLIRIAARSLAQNSSIEVIVWCNAANDGAHLLQLTKGLHQPEGPFSDLVPDTNFTSKFHLYARVLNPTPSQNGYRLQPTRLSYQTIGNAYNVGKGFLEADIPSAPAISSDLTSKG